VVGRPRMLPTSRYARQLTRIEIRRAHARFPRRVAHVPMVSAQRNYWLAPTRVICSLLIAQAPTTGSRRQREDDEGDGEGHAQHLEQRQQQVGSQGGAVDVAATAASAAQLLPPGATLQAASHVGDHLQAAAAAAAAAAAEEEETGSAEPDEGEEGMDGRAGHDATARVISTVPGSAPLGRPRKVPRLAPTSDGGDEGKGGLPCRNHTGYIGVRKRNWGMFAAEIRDGAKRR
jgi:hypothetical protein